MKIYQGISSFKKLSKAVVTTGTFDGVHLGHKKIFSKLISVAKKKEMESVLITFRPHPRIVLFPDNELKLINSIEENINLFKLNKIDHLIFQNFDLKFSRVSSFEYVRDILCNKIGLKELVIGYNHHFGRNREGSSENLQDYAELFSFNIHQVDPFQLGDLSISSSKIREALNKGSICLANKFLGYNFSLTGRVIKGRGAGNNLGFPTANIELFDKNKILPLNGVYAVKILFNHHAYKGMLNIGYNPTFGKNKLSIEAHIFNFNQNIYNETITIEFIKRIRNEKKFLTVDLLKKQISMDKISALNILI